MDVPAAAAAAPLAAPTVAIRLLGHDDEVQSLAWRSDLGATHWLASGGRDRAVRVWDTVAGGAALRTHYIAAPQQKDRVWVAVAWVRQRLLTSSLTYVTCTRAHTPTPAKERGVASAHGPRRFPPRAARAENAVDPPR